MIIMSHTNYKSWLGILASIFLGMTFIVAGSGKLFAGVVDFQLLTIPDFWPFLLAKFLTTWLMQVELLVGVVLVAGIFAKCAAGFSLPLIAGFIINNILLINSGLGGEPCNCFGMGQELTVIGSLCLDGIMVALAVVILMWYPAKFFEVRPWYWGNRRSKWL